MTTRTRTLLLLLAALVLFVLALLVSAGWLVHSGNYSALIAGGLVAVTAAALSERLP